MKTVWLVLLIVASTLILSLVTIKLLFLPAWAPQNNFSSAATANIATSINGIVSPVIGVLTSILLYLTLSKQIEGIREQKVQNNSDAIVAALQLCQKSVDDFYYKYTQGTGPAAIHKFTGQEAIFEFTLDFCYRKDSNWRKEKGYTYGDGPEAIKLEWIISAFEICKQRIKVAQVSPEVKEVFKRAANAFYRTQLAYPLSSLSTMFHIFPHLIDDDARRVQAFYRMMENKDWDERARAAILR